MPDHVAVNDGGQLKPLSSSPGKDVCVKLEVKRLDIADAKKWLVKRAGNNDLGDDLVERFLSFLKMDKFVEYAGLRTEICKVQGGDRIFKAFWSFLKKMGECENIMSGNMDDDAGVERKTSKDYAKDDIEDNDNDDKIAADGDKDGKTVREARKEETLGTDWPKQGKDDGREGGSDLDARDLDVEHPSHEYLERDSGDGASPNGRKDEEHTESNRRDADPKNVPDDGLRINRKPERDSNVESGKDREFDVMRGSDYDYGDGLGDNSKRKTQRGLIAEEAHESGRGTDSKHRRDRYRRVDSKYCRDSGRHSPKRDLVSDSRIDLERHRSSGITRDSPHDRFGENDRDLDRPRDFDQNRDSESFDSGRKYSDSDYRQRNYGEPGSQRGLQKERDSLLDSRKPDGIASGGEKEGLFGRDTAAAVESSHEELLSDEKERKSRGTEESREVQKESGGRRTLRDKESLRNGDGNDHAGLRSRPGRNHGDYDRDYEYRQRNYGERGSKKKLENERDALFDSRRPDAGASGGGKEGQFVRNTAAAIHSSREVVFPDENEWKNRCMKESRKVQTGRDGRRTFRGKESLRNVDDDVYTGLPPRPGRDSVREYERRQRIHRDRGSERGQEKKNDALLKSRKPDGHASGSEQERLLDRDTAGAVQSSREVVLSDENEAKSRAMGESREVQKENSGLKTRKDKESLRNVDDTVYTGQRSHIDSRANEKSDDDRYYSDRRMRRSPSRSDSEASRERRRRRRRHRRREEEDEEEYERRRRRHRHRRSSRSRSRSPRRSISEERERELRREERRARRRERHLLREEEKERRRARKRRHGSEASVDRYDRERDVDELEPPKIRGRHDYDDEHEHQRNRHKRRKYYDEPRGEDSFSDGELSVDRYRERRRVRRSRYDRVRYDEEDRRRRDDKYIGGYSREKEVNAEMLHRSSPLQGHDVDRKIQRSVGPHRVGDRLHPSRQDLTISQRRGAAPRDARGEFGSRRREEFRQRSVVLPKEKSTAAEGQKWRHAKVISGETQHKSGLHGDAGQAGQKAQRPHVTARLGKPVLRDMPRGSIAQISSDGISKGLQLKISEPLSGSTPWNNTTNKSVGGEERAVAKERVKPKVSAGVLDLLRSKALAGMAKKSSSKGDEKSI